MKTFGFFMAVTAAIIMISLSSGLAFAYDVGNPMTGGKSMVRNQPNSCSTEFSQLDTGHKGYLTYNDFLAAFNGLGGHKGIAPSGNGPSAFASADRNGDGRVTQQEFCAWKNSKSY